ncbi:hypothetical protein L873DRAFT_1717084 [Choiromyces venosus 120613-1]|uniref:Tr-type G domain-containing protein n=1 Tax=Choiromyces venosus 120613-1 TaxID=1336337 RepID=A0A3N4J0R4_9PEZI|nr:hypothetical protein L873DRAFT_1717084 [Choiromyces venosus 120613-1]
MSRHKNIRNLDVYAELDDFDGDDYEEDSNGKLREGLAQVRETLGTDIPVTDKEIRESLWYYYFDVSKTIDYILSQFAPAEKPKKKPQPQSSQKAQKGAPTAAQTKAFSEPSPDDIVIAAQSTSKGLNNTKKKKTDKPVEKNKPVEKIEAAVQAMVIDNTPVKARKKIDVLEEFKNTKTKENANFVVIGHVDAGKSTLMGRLLYDCGVIDERTIQKFKAEAEKIGKSSFHFAWVLDQTNEERSRYDPLSILYLARTNGT